MCEDVPVSTSSLAVAFAGTGLSLASAVFNGFFFVCLLRNSRLKSCYFNFLLYLALFDVLVSLCYVPVIVVDLLKDELRSTTLASLWWLYYAPLLALTSASMTAARFVSFESRFAPRFLFRFPLDHSATN